MIRKLNKKKLEKQKVKLSILLKREGDHGNLVKVQALFCITLKERPCLNDKHENRKKLIPCVEKPPYFGSSNMEKENHISTGDKPVEVTPNRRDKKTRWQEAGQMENQTVKSSKEGTPQKSELSILWHKKSRRDCPSRSDREDVQTSSRAAMEVADTEIIKAVIKELEVLDLLGDSEGVKGLHVENPCQPPVENAQKGDTARGGEITENGEHLELLVPNRRRT